MKKRASKKVEGSDYGQVPVEGLKQARAGEKGKNRPNPDAVGQKNIISKNLKPYPNQKVVRKPEWGDIEIQESGDDKARAKFVDEN
jgi:hypothetical protein